MKIEAPRYMCSQSSLVSWMFLDVGSIVHYCLLTAPPMTQQEMLGFTLSTACSNHFCNRPCGFKFTTLDISDAPMRCASMDRVLIYREAEIIIGAMHSFWES